MTKQELQEWVDKIPDDIFEQAYVLDPWHRRVQLEYSHDIIKEYFPKASVTFDENGFFECEMSFGRITFT